MRKVVLLSGGISHLCARSYLGPRVRKEDIKSLQGLLLSEAFMYDGARFANYISAAVQRELDVDFKR